MKLKKILSKLFSSKKDEKLKFEFCQLYMYERFGLISKKGKKLKDNAGYLISISSPKRFKDFILEIKVEDDANVSATIIGCPVSDDKDLYNKLVDELYESGAIQKIVDLSIEQIANKAKNIIDVNSI